MKDRYIIIGDVEDECWLVVDTIIKIVIIKFPSHHLAVSACSVLNKKYSENEAK